MTRTMSVSVLPDIHKMEYFNSCEMNYQKDCHMEMKITNNKTHIENKKNVFKHNDNKFD